MIDSIMPYTKKDSTILRRLNNLLKEATQEQMNAAPGDDRASRIEYVNSHREAMDRPPIPDTVSDEELKRHEQLIDDNAPYGNDPWDA